MQSGQPIPASFYDEDYYSGKTSNYTHGYTWDEMGQLFVVTARLLMGLFPDATRFLDFGAAKGFLVRALCEEGKAAWGVEHSPYCLETAEEIARPFLVRTLDQGPWLAPKTSSRCPSFFDVVTAFETLEHLTMEQIAEVLPALRAHATCALFATIPVTDPYAQPRWARKLADKDPTHVTIVDRAWWLEQFTQAGFVHGPWQHIAELYCKAHPLCQQAGWNVFVLGIENGTR